MWAPLLSGCRAVSAGGVEPGLSAMSGAVSKVSLPIASAFRGPKLSRCVDSLVFFRNPVFAFYRVLRLDR